MAWHGTMTRRRFLQYGAGAGAALAFPWPRSSRASAAVGPTLDKFVQPLPVPLDGIAVAQSNTFRQVATTRQLHPKLPPTPLWGYDDGVGLGWNEKSGSFNMAVVARRGEPLDLSFTHALGGAYPEWIPVDARLTGAIGAEVRLLTHLHGGFTPAADDGNPSAAEPFEPGGTQHVHYPNAQPASLLWFHDHGLGTTRLNVFAGLAAAYLLRDSDDTGDDANSNGLPSGAYEIPLVIQDRRFRKDGALLYPTSPIPGVTWIGEYFGDVMLVNGKVWPYLEVEPRLYRFRVLNGCNARILNLDAGAMTFWQIGAEGGMWDIPVRMERLVLAPAERADVLVDFSRFAGKTLLLRNAKPPTPVATPAPGLTAVMQFRVGTTVTQPGPTTLPATLQGGARADLPSPSGETPRRFITLNEVAAESADWHLNLNGAGYDRTAGLIVKAGDVEDWVYVNLTGDTHPMHTHLVTFQVIGRTPFDAERYEDENEGEDGVPGGIDPSPYATGEMEPPGPDERGFKDTVKANPGYFTTIRARFALPPGVTAPQSYVHHCHIVEHEDNDMMETFTVGA